MAAFTPNRLDGRSSSTVIVDHVKEGAPGTLYEFADLITVLNTGSERVHGVSDVRKVVSSCIARLLRDHQRRLHNVRGLGYRLAPAREHMSLARHDHRRADVQMKKGLNTLRHVRWDEMDDDSRKAHEGHLMITEAIYASQRAQDQRLNKIEAILSGLK